MVSRSVSHIVDSSPASPGKRPTDRPMDIRLHRVNGRWLAAADAPTGPIFGWGSTAAEAVSMALDPLIDQLQSVVADERRPEEFIG